MDNSMDLRHTRFQGVRVLTGQRLAWLLAVVAGTSVGYAQPVEPAKPADQSGPVTVPGEEDATTEDPDFATGREVFTRASRAAREMQTVSYSIRTSATQSLEAVMPKVEADVRAVRNPGPGTQWLVRGTGDITRGGVVAEFDVAWRASSVEWLDYEAKKIMERSEREAKAAARLTAVRVDEIFAHEPFRDALRAKAYEVKPREIVDGVECDVVTVLNSAAAITTWYIGVDDGLPRRRSTTVDSRTMSGSMLTELSNVRASSDRNSASAAAELVRVSAPADFTEDRKLPPTPPPPSVKPPASQPAAGKGEPAATPATPAVPAAPVEIKIPAFDLKTADGQSVTDQSLRGHVSVVAFGGSWCLAMPDLNPELQRLSDDLAPRGVKVFAAMVRERDTANAIEQARRDATTFPLLLSADRAAADFGVQRFPTIFVISADGVVMERIDAYQPTESIMAIRSAVGRALGNGASATAESGGGEAPKDK